MAQSYAPALNRCGRGVAMVGALALTSCAAPLVDWEPRTPSSFAASPACAALSAAAGGASVHWTTFSAPGAETPPDWCRSVGPVVYVPAPRPSAVRVEELVLASWNIRVGAGDVPGFVADLRSGALTGKPVNDFVLLLQEAYRAGTDVPDPVSGLTSRIAVLPPSGERVDVVELARELGLHVLYVPSMPNGREQGTLPEDRGNAVLSTIPLRDLAAVELPFEAQRRVVAAATVSGFSDGKPWSLRVASGHLDTRSRWSRVLDSFGVGRGRQAAALDRTLEGERIVLGADLNTWSLGPLESALDVLQQSFPDTPRLSAATFLAAGLIPRRLDHLLFRLSDRDEATLQRADDRYGSDHYPMIGSIRFESAEGAREGASLRASRS